MQWPIKVLKLMNEGVGSNQVKGSSEKRALKLSRFLKEPRVKSYIKKKGGKQNKHMQIV